MKMYRSMLVTVVFLFAFLMFVGCQPSQEATAEEVTPAQEVLTDKTEVQPAEAATVTGEAPMLEVEKTVCDFGEMAPSASEKGEYSFKNIGNATLKIDRIQSTCGCTVPQLKKKEYAPGESGVIKITFRAPSTKGSVTKHLYIMSNDPKQPRFELSVKVSVAVKVSISPENVKLHLNEDNAGMPKIVVKSLDEREFSIKSITIGREVMKVPFDPAKKAKEFVLEPVVNKDKLNEFNTGVVQVKTDHPQAGSLVVRYNAVPAYEVTRPRIILQNVEPGVAVVKDVIVRSNYGTPVEIESVNSRNGYMEIESQEKDGENLQLKIKITPPDQESSSRRYITDELTITLKDQTELSIRCSGWFKLG